MQRVGIPMALYVDRHGVFRHTPGSGLPGTSTQFSRAMDELGIQMIFALSPQGRVESGCWNLPGPAGDRTPFGGRRQHRRSQRRAGAVSAAIQPALPGPPAMFRVRVPAAGLRSVPGAGPVLQAPQESGQGQYGEVPTAYAAVAARSRNAPAMPVRSWRYWKDWTAASGCATRDASSPPRRRRPARYSSVTARAIRPLLSFPPAGCLLLGPALGSHPQGTGLKDGE